MFDNRVSRTAQFVGRFVVSLTRIVFPGQFEAPHVSPADLGVVSVGRFEVRTNAHRSLVNLLLAFLARGTATLGELKDQTMRERVREEVQHKQMTDMRVSRGFDD